jgi:hypothetical protein
MTTDKQIYKFTIFALPVFARCAPGDLIRVIRVGRPGHETRRRVRSAYLVDS